MKLISFKVEEFRSIATTGWLPFSVDGVTALVGQNESGKSAILDALHAAFGSSGNVSSDDFRRGGGLSGAALRVSLTAEELSEVCAELPGDCAAAVNDALKDRRENLVFISRFIRSGTGGSRRVFRLEQDVLKLIEVAITKSMPAASGDDTKTEAKAFVSSGCDTFIDSFWKKLPLFVLFREEDSYLPNTVDIDEAKKEWLEGSQHEGADNFLLSAGIELEDLLVEDDRDRASVLSAGVRVINKSLADYWRQVLGQRGKIKIEVEFSRHPPTHARAGAAYLRFWISEADGEKLHPSQRSKGTRWYVAFFLHLTASQKDGDPIVLLLDEPGAYLHATAQEDVLRLVENLGSDIPVLYSTHSPYLIDHKRIDRILAVERDADDEDSNTIVRRGLELAASSQLTLAPVLAVMGGAHCDWFLWGGRSVCGTSLNTNGSDSTPTTPWGPTAIPGPNGRSAGSAACLPWSSGPRSWRRLDCEGRLKLWQRWMQTSFARRRSWRACLRRPSSLLSTKPSRRLLWTPQCQF